jgi:hypothetical protein
MAIIVKGSDFVPAPEGMHSAVGVDAIDLGKQETPWGPKHKVVLVWEIDAVMEDGKRFTVRRRYTASLNEKSNLYKDLVAWRGRDFTPKELKGFDIEQVIGAACQVFVEHTQKDGQVYANVRVVTKAPAGPKLAPSGQYIRVKDRQPDQQSAAAEEEEADSYEADSYDTMPVEDPIPF